MAAPPEMTASLTTAERREHIGIAFSPWRIGFSEKIVRKKRLGRDGDSKIRRKVNPALAGKRRERYLVVLRFDCDPRSIADDDTFAAAAVFARDRRAKGTRRRGCLEHARPGACRRRLYGGQPLAQPR